MIYLVEIEGYNPVTESVEILRFCNGEGFITKPNESPANTIYYPRLSQAGSLSATMFDSGSTSGASTIAYGEVTVRNIDGAYDYLADWGFDGRTITCRKGEQGASYPSGFTILYVATMQQVIPEFNKLTWRLRDKQYLLDKPIQKQKFLGNNTLPYGIEGTVNDIKDKFKPMVHGKVWNFSPVCVNTSKLIYAINIRDISQFDALRDVDSIGNMDNAAPVTGSVSTFDDIVDMDSVTDVDASSGPLIKNSGIVVTGAYDGGAALTEGGLYNTEEELYENAPDPGSYRVWLTEGYIRLGLPPTGNFTVDCADLGSSTNDLPTVANLMMNLLVQEAVVPVESINTDDFALINAANSDVVGVATSLDEVRFPAVFDELCGSIGAWYGFDRLGIFRMKQISLPLENPVLYVTDSPSYERLSITDTKNGVPANKVIMKWRKNYTVINSTEMITVDEDRKAALGLQYRETEVRDDTVTTKHLLADSITVTTAFYDEPTTEAQRQLAIYKERRDRFRVRIPLGYPGSEQVLTLGTVINVKLPRFNLQNGKNLMVIGFTLDCINNWVDTIVWG